jgi:hypothetical protein
VVLGLGGSPAGAACDFTGSFFDEEPRAPLAVLTLSSSEKKAEPDLVALLRGFAADFFVDKATVAARGAGDRTTSSFVGFCDD